jgi:P63C domain
LARLEGVRYAPRSRPLRCGKYVMLFVYDSIDPDVGKELRKKNPNPSHGRNHHQ